MKNANPQQASSRTKPDIRQEDHADILVIDDAFPHPLSAFRMQEFTSYLQECENLKVYSSGLSARILGTQSLPELFADFTRKHPEYASRIGILNARTTIHVRLIYLVFLWTAYQYIGEIEKAGVPFVFTLYPGGKFGLHNAESDRMLKRVTSSPCFRKVIVTQRIVYQYLIEKHFCTPDQIETIFGVVTPLESIEKEYTGKRRFGTDKNTLDVCFAAHKYTEKGVDKGYDVFVGVARELCKRHENIRFHVVGGFDENEMDVSDIRDKITFYGRRDMEWFDEFYRDKDIILSPNVPFMIFDGSFDGFPTGTSVDAGLRKTALFCTDELKMNTHFTDGKDIVIIPHDAGEIAGIIEHYYRNPEKLKAIAENGYQRIRQVYSFEAQMAPRIRILTEELEKAGQSKRLSFEDQGSWSRPTLKQRLGQGILSSAVALKRMSPRWLKSMLGGANRSLHSNQALLGFLKRHAPDFVIKLYRRLTED